MKGSPTLARGSSSRDPLSSGTILDRSHIVVNFPADQSLNIAAETVTANFSCRAR
jgi:hypothetical protein